MSAQQKTPPTQTASDPFGVMPGLGGATPNILGQLQTEAQAGEAVPLLLWIGRNRRAIIAAFVILVLCVIGYGLWQWQMEKSDREAQLRLGRILVIDDPAARIKGLETYLPTAPAAMQPGVNLEIAIAAVAAKDFDRAIAAYKAVRTALPQSATGVIAALNEAALLLQMNKSFEAVAVYDSLTSVPEFMKAPVSERKGLALELAGRLEEALALYKSMPEMADNAGTDYIRYKINLLTEKLKK